MGKLKGNFRFIETENITTLIVEDGARAGEMYYAMSTRNGIRTLLPRDEEYNYEVFNYNRKGSSGETLMPARGIEVTTPNGALQVVDFGGLEAVYYCMVVTMGDEGFADLINFYDEETYIKLVENPTGRVYANYAIKPVKATNLGAKDDNGAVDNTQNPYKDTKAQNEELDRLTRKFQKEKQELQTEIAYLKLVNDSLMNKKEEVERPQEFLYRVEEPNLAFIEPKPSNDTAFIITILVITFVLSVAIGMLIMMLI